MVDLLNNREVKLSPSILSVALEDVAVRLKKIEDLIDYVHIDVMDGKFVANKTNGVGMFDEARKASCKPLDVHLMVENPIEEIKKYKGAEVITFHIEAVKSEDEALEIIEMIKSFDAKAGISVRPNTSISTLINLLNKLDLVLIMTVEPGYGGQKLIPETLEKVKELRDLGFEGLIEVDGGINTENADLVRKYDVDVIVAGTAIFSAADELYAVEKIKK